jgi:Flp pilus assembly protein TadG
MGSTVTPKLAHRLLSECVRVLKDQSGQILIYFTILLPVMLGLIGLALEGGRFLMLHSQLQDLADAAAIAGAKELNGADDAIARATNAAEKVLTNDTWWSNVALAGAQTVDPPVFCSQLQGVPADNPAPADVCQPDPKVTPENAAYIKVTTVERQVTPTFLVAVGASASTTKATATAGSTFVACSVQPLMLCNPNEPNEFTAKPGDLFGFSQTGNTGVYSRGDFNLLDPAGQARSHAMQIRNLLAAVNPNFCYIDNVSTAQGQKIQDLADGINVRFDIPPQGGNATGLDKTPAPNVVKGELSNQDCSHFMEVGNGAMPINTDMATVGSTLVGGTWNTSGANGYWQYHHYNAASNDPTLASLSWPTANGAANGAPITRYSMYQRERAGIYPFNPYTEIPAQQCTRAPAGSDTRRIISVAIVNCSAQNVSGYSNKVLMANEYAQFFLTDPVTADGPSKDIIWAEFVRIVTPSTPGGFLHQIVQLYRDQ